MTHRPRPLQALVSLCDAFRISISARAPEPSRTADSRAHLNKTEGLKQRAVSLKRAGEGLVCLSVCRAQTVTNREPTEGTVFDEIRVILGLVDNSLCLPVYVTSDVTTGFSASSNKLTCAFFHTVLYITFVCVRPSQTTLCCTKVCVIMVHYSLLLSTVVQGFTVQSGLITFPTSQTENSL